jgi:type III secretory pathway component EscR
MHARTLTYAYTRNSKKHEEETREGKRLALKKKIETQQTNSSARERERERRRDRDRQRQTDSLQALLLVDCKSAVRYE